MKSKSIFLNHQLSNLLKNSKFIGNLNILHTDIMIKYLIICGKLETTSSDTHCTHYLIEKLDDENGKLHRQCLCAISKFKVQNLEFIELQIATIKIANIAL